MFFHQCKQGMTSKLVRFWIRSGPSFVDHSLKFSEVYLPIAFSRPRQSKTAITKRDHLLLPGEATKLDCAGLDFCFNRQCPAALYCYTLSMPDSTKHLFSTTLPRQMQLGCILPSAPRTLPSSLNQCPQNLTSAATDVSCWWVETSINPKSGTPLLKQAQSRV